MLKFIKTRRFYKFDVHEFNIPAGHTCPFAKDCKICVDRYTGKFDTTGDLYRCYAAISERYPNVRKQRWANLEGLYNGEIPVVPKEATHVRIHGSGDFYSQGYFDMWLDVVRKNPEVKFWAFTKSIQFWINRLGQIPMNLQLNASYGGYQDHLIGANHLKFAVVYNDIKVALATGLPIDKENNKAMNPGGGFILLDKNIIKHKERELYGY